MNCDGCGACCLEQQSPPGYIAIILGYEMDAADMKRVEALAPELRRELLDYIEIMDVADDHPNNDICLWFDEETRKCKHYDIRPSICREVLLPGDDGCLRWRKLYKIQDTEKGAGDGCNP